MVTKKKILITGGLGFVGSRLTAYFLENENYNVIISTRQAPEKIKKLPIDKLTIIDLSKMSDNQIESLCKSIDSIIHLASLNEIDSVTYLKQAIDINIWETVRLHDIAAANGVSNFIYFSTAHVYKSPLTGTFNEDSKCIPEHPYSITHKTAEDFILAKRNKTPINSIVIRLSNSFGYPAYDTSDRWTLLVNDICKQAVTTQKIVLKGNGKQLRNFVCLENVCNTVSSLLRIEKEKLGNGIVNLGSDKNISIFKMASIVKERFDQKNDTNISIEINEDDKSESLNLNFQIEKLKELNIIHFNNFDKEIDGMIDFCINKFTK